MSNRPTLKLTFSNKKAEQPQKKSPTPPPPPPSSQPAASNAPTKLKLKFGPRPSEEQPAKPKKRAKATPAAKENISKKRSHDVLKTDTASESRPSASTVVEGTPIKRIKFSSKPKLPTSIRLKSKGAPPVRPKGAGYDSEASDTERDPALEEQFILRMQPGEDCEYLRQAIEEKRFGPRSQGGADVMFKSLTKDGRRTMITICGHMYAASLVDLPSIVEGLKSWDKRGWYKSADICQMLLVLGRVESEEEARNYPLPRDVDPTTFQFSHGITPPMKFARKRRFRKRISNRTIEAVELEVARLIREDAAAVKAPDYEVLDHAQYMREQQGGEEDYEMYDDEQDAEGELDEGHYADEQPADDIGDAFEDELAAEMEAALAAHADEASSVPASATADAGEVIQEVETEAELEAGTPHSKVQTADTSGDEDESEESSPEDANADLDEDALDQQRQLQEQREEIAELEALVQAETIRWEQMKNPILKSKLGKRVQSLKQALDLKKVSIGEGD